MAGPDLRARVEAAGMTNLAQLYCAVKYTRDRHDAFSARVRAYLTRQGFAGDLERGAAAPAPTGSTCASASTSPASTAGAVSPSW